MKKLLYICMALGLTFVGAEAETLLLTVTGTDGTTEQRVPMTAGTTLRISGSNTVEVVSDEDFKTAIGLGDASDLDVGTTAGTVAAGDDSRFDITQSGSGAVPRTLSDKATDTVSVKDFGAVGDNSTDDTAAFQAALDSERNVYIPNGRYKLTDTLISETTGQIIRGESKFATILDWSTVDVPGFNLRVNTATGVDPGGIGATHQVGGTLSTVMMIGNSSSTKIGVFYGTTPDTYIGDATRIEHVALRQWDVGIDFDGIAKPYVLDTQVSSCRVGYDVTGSSQNTPLFSGVSASQCTEAGILSSAKGGVFFLADFAANEIDVKVTGGNSSFFGGELESYDDRCFHITTASVSIQGPRILAAEGETTPPIYATGGSVVYLNNVAPVQFATTTALAEVASANDKIIGHGYLGSMNNGSWTSANVNDTVLLSNGEKNKIGLPSLPHTNIPAASVSARGGLLLAATSGIADRLLACVADEDGNFSWQDILNSRMRFTLLSVSTSHALVANTINRAGGGGSSRQTFTLPASALVDDEIVIVGTNTGLWRVAQNAGQFIRIGDKTTTTGTGGYIDSENRAAWTKLKCVVEDTTWQVVGYGGILTLDTGVAVSRVDYDFAADKTITAGATTGAQTIDKNAGSVNFAASAASLVVTNSRVTTSSVIVATVATNDTTMTSVQAVAGAGSFTLYPDAVPTAETRVNFWIVN